MAETPPVPPNALAAYTVVMSTLLDVIESTRPVLPLLIADQTRDPRGLEPIHLGLAGYRPDGTLARVVWL
jgi:hypothetical protein